MRYFIEVEAVAKRTRKGKIVSNVHVAESIKRRKVYPLAICEKHIYRLEEVDSPVTRKRCLAILEKQGRCEDDN